MIFQLAWRNLWRNPRRTIIIIIAVVVGVFSMILLGALMRGVLQGMIDNNIQTLTGEIKVYRQGYRGDPVIENAMENGDAITSRLSDALPAGAHWAARIRVPAVANNARHTAGVTLVGIDPEAEARVSFIGDATDQGRYLKSGDEYKVLVGRALLNKFETEPGKKLVLMSQDTGNEIASRAFRIVGVYRAEMEETEKRFVFVEKQSAAGMLKLPESAVSEISIMLPDRRRVPEVTAKLQAAMPEEIEVKTWRELLPIVQAYIDIMNGFISLWYVVVFIAMAFGIVNTLLMAIHERMREFGILKAVGMKSHIMIGGVLTESALLLVMGTLIGNLLSWPILWLWADRGLDISAMAAGAEYAGMARVIYPVVAGRDVWLANLTVVGLGLAVSLYPAYKASRFTPVEAMRQV